MVKIKKTQTYAMMLYPKMANHRNIMANVKMAQDLVTNLTQYFIKINMEINFETFENRFLSNEFWVGTI